MDWLDYRVKLGIGFSSEEKFTYFKRKLYNFIDEIDGKSSYSEYYEFCNLIGTSMNHNYPEGYDVDFDSIRYRTIISAVKERSSFVDLLSYYIAFVNTTENKRAKAKLYNALCIMLKESHIQFEVIKDKDGYFVFPKGATELDSTLVSAPLEWLNTYPDSRKAFVKALKEYADATEETASDVADKFRKALETFFQEFFGGRKSLENYKAEYGSFLKAQGVPKEISGNYETILQAYANFMNNYAKHRNATSDKILEYIMYQTGNIIRLLIILKQK